MIQLLALITYIVIALYALVWCENEYHASTKRGLVYKAGDSTKREPLYKAGDSTKRGTLQSGGLYKAGDSTKREASPLSQPPQVAQAP